MLDDLTQGVVLCNRLFVHVWDNPFLPSPPNPPSPPHTKQTWTHTVLSHTCCCTHPPTHSFKSVKWLTEGFSVSMNQFGVKSSPLMMVSAMRMVRFGSGMPRAPPCPCCTVWPPLPSLASQTMLGTQPVQMKRNGPHLERSGLWIVVYIIVIFPD